MLIPSILFPIFFICLPFCTATHYFLIDCGSSSKATSDNNGRKWDGDIQSKVLPSNAAEASWPVSLAAEQDPSLSLPAGIPYTTARFSFSTITYNFDIPFSGSIFLRLHFHRASYHNHNLDSANSSFSVIAGDHHTLLSNFNAADPVVSSFIKEFIITVGDNQMLDLTFSPSPTSYAFINGIEIVPIPSNHYIKGKSSLIKLISTPATSSNFTIESNTALENVYRLKVGGNDVGVTEDTGMFRAWSQDEPYLYSELGLVPHLDFPIRYTEETPNYTAPEKVYTTLRSMGPRYTYFNLTWIFPVDSGFHYLMRLHFCEFLKEVTLRNQRVFTIFINNQTAESQADVIDWTHNQGNKIPVFKDYIVWVTDPEGHHSKQDLWLSMRPNLDSNPQFADAFLNGLEIFKLNGTDGSLAGENLLIRTNHSERSKDEWRKKKLPLGALIGGIFGVVVVFSILSFLMISWRFGKVKGSTFQRDAKSSSNHFLFKSRSMLQSTGEAKLRAADDFNDLQTCRRFTLAEVQAATCNFDETRIVGKGGFGEVYRGFLGEYGTKMVAIKRLNSKSKQGAQEYWAEVDMLSKLKHINILPLIGYCDDSNEMIIVYEYMSNGTLCDHLYKNQRVDIPHLPWKQRIKICLGAARGLEYLHTGIGAQHRVIHRDVKSSNILLDENWIAKVSDFGLSKIGPSNQSCTFVSTNVKGTFGYLDPEYSLTHRLTRKSDVYALGVVLFEALGGRPALDMGLEEEQHSLALWAKNCVKEGRIDEIIDRSIKGEVSSCCLKAFVEIAAECLHYKAEKRPTMADVVVSLELALSMLQKGVNSFSAEAEENVLDAIISVDGPSSESEECFEYSSLEIQSMLLKIK